MHWSLFLVMSVSSGLIHQQSCHLSGYGTSTCVSSISVDSVLGHLASSFDLTGDLILHGHASLTGARFITVYLFINAVHLTKSLDRVLCSMVTVLWAAMFTHISVYISSFLGLLTWCILM